MDHRPDQSAEADFRLSERSASREVMPPSTRRRFLKLGTAATVGASALLGRFVAFTPSADALIYNCIHRERQVDFDCWGNCKAPGLTSCCTISSTQQCCVTCTSGTGYCRAYANQKPDRRDVCCYATC